MNGDFAISISKDAVEVRLQPSSRSPHGKLRGAIVAAAIVAGVPCAAVIVPGKHGAPSMWQEMSKSSIMSGSLWVLLVALIVLDGFLAWLCFRWSAAAWPSDEILRCDRTTLTISRVPYLDFSNRTWVTKSYALRDIRRMRFAVYASAKGMSMYGFRFETNGQEHKILPSLEAPEALSILKALQGLGVDAVVDDKLEKKVAETQEMRGSQMTTGL